MHKIFATIATIATIATMTSSSCFADTYISTFILTSCNYYEGYAEGMDADGEIWAFYMDDDFYREGDVITALMSDEGTKTLWDDEVIYTQYSGFNFDVFSKAVSVK